MVRALRLTAVLVAVCATWALPSWAAAHAAFQDASPEPGARLHAPPRQIRLAFTEPLNRELTSARLVEARSHLRVASEVRLLPGRRLVLVPRRRLATGAYRVEWHTVSLLDGHALEGSFGFGVRTAAVGGEQRLEQNPLARDGWLRVMLRWAFYAALFFFTAGLLCGLALSPSGAPAEWLVPEEARSHRPGSDLAASWRRTRAVGWIAAGLGTAVALAETADAAGSLTWHAVDAYLLSTSAGAARGIAALAALAAAALAARAGRLAAVLVVVALAAVAVGGHASSASPRGLALLADWLHLVAAAIWAGGIAQIAATWLPGVAGMPAAARRAVMRGVLARFGRLALPAFCVVVAAGAANALLELGRPSELWSSGYGRILLVKITLVAAIGLASYVHALRLRPRLLGKAAEWTASERHHWRLLGAEPGIAVAVLGATALLAASPLPPHQLLERAEAGQEIVAAARLGAPRADELSVAEAAGRWIAAAWVRRGEASIGGTIRLLDFNARPVRAAIRVAGGDAHPCGTGCATFRVRGSPAELRVVASSRARTETAVLPIRWEPRGTAAAERILGGVVRGIDRLRAMRIFERLTSGLGGASVSRYRIGARDRYQIKAINGGPPVTVAIGRRVWLREPDGSWMVERDPQLADFRDLLPWWTHRRAIRLLDTRRVAGRRIAEIALADVPSRPGSASPFWFRLRVDTRTMRPLAMRMIAPAHFMNQRYFAFGMPNPIHPPHTLR